MDDHHVGPINRDRAELAAASSRVAEKQDDDAIEALRLSLESSVATLRRLYEDEGLWARAGAILDAAVETDGDDSASLALVARARDAVEVGLPGLLTLFGYTDPPPPPLDALVRDTVSALEDGLGGVSAADAWEARDDLGRALDRIEPLLERRDAPAVIHYVKAAEEVRWWQEFGIVTASGTAFGAVGAAVTGAAVLVGGALGGAGALAPALVLLGLRGLRRKKAAKAAADAAGAAVAASEDDDPTASELLAGAQAAANYHIEMLEGLCSTEPVDLVEARVHLDRLAAITLVFAGVNQHVASWARQERLHKRHGPSDLLNRLKSLHVATGSVLTHLYDRGGLEAPDFAPVLEIGTNVRVVDLDRVEK